MIADATGSPAAWVLIVVAAITAVPTLIAVMVSNFRTKRENRSQHGTSVESLRSLSRDVQHLTGKVEGLDDHLTTIDAKVDRLGERTAIVEAHIGDSITGTGHRRFEVHVERMDDPTRPPTGEPK